MIVLYYFYSTKLISISRIEIFLYCGNQNYYKIKFIFLNLYIARKYDNISKLTRLFIQ